MTVSETAASSAPLQGHASIEVLIAEDDPMFRKILQSWLESWDYHVTVAEEAHRRGAFCKRRTLPNCSSSTG
jgi:CheY-like chemotaxis protein